MIEQKVDDLKRLDEITRVLAKQETGYILDKLNLASRLPIYKRISLEREEHPSPERLRETIEELGPTFIKLGQILAQRPDIVPQKYIEELEKLEDSVPPFSSDKAIEIIDEEVDTENFQFIKTEPKAAASIAQVHEAKLQNGKEVIIKVRRPGIKQQINTDLEIIDFLAKKIEKHFKKARQTQIRKVITEFSEWTRNELDFNREQKNAEMFKENLSDEEKLKVPQTYPELTTEKVLVMEKVEGVKCTETEKLKQIDTNNKEIAKTITRGVIKQSVRDGFFHADPHPSNFLIKDDGTIVYLDFGMMGKITKRNRELLGLLLVHAINENVEGGLETMKKMGYVEEDANLEGLKEDLEQKLVKINHNTLRETQVSRELLDLAINASEHGVHLPSSMTLVGKSMITMEGIGLTLYPEFKMGEEYKEIAEKILKEQNKPEELAKTFAIDLIQNKDLITNFPTKLNKKLEPKNREIKIVQEPKHQFTGKHLIAGTLLLCATLLVVNTINPATQSYLAILAVLASLYLLIDN